MEKPSSLPSAKLFTWNLKDIAKGLITAILGVVVTGVYTSISAGELPSDWIAWKPILLSGVGAGLAYLMKNFLSNSNGEFAKKEVAPLADNK